MPTSRKVVLIVILPALFLAGILVIFDLRGPPRGKLESSSPTTTQNPSTDVHVDQHSSIWREALREGGEVTFTEPAKSQAAEESSVTVTSLGALSDDEKSPAYDHLLRSVQSAQAALTEAIEDESESLTQFKKELVLRRTLVRFEACLEMLRADKYWLFDSASDANNVPAPGAWSPRLWNIAHRDGKPLHLVFPVYDNEWPTLQNLSNEIKNVSHQIAHQEVSALQALPETKRRERVEAHFRAVQGLRDLDLLPPNQRDAKRRELKRQLIHPWIRINRTDGSVSLSAR